MAYERLTTKDEEGNWQIWEDDYSHPFEALQVAIDRLAELEDKIENGTLKEIPENAVVITNEKTAKEIWNDITSYYFALRILGNATVELDKLAEFWHKRGVEVE